MGSSNNKEQKSQETTQHGQIYIRTHKAEFKAGDTVTGEIYLNLVETFPGTELYLRLKGKEAMVYFEIIHNGQQTTRRRIHYKETFLKLDKVVHTFDRLGPGQIVIPFAFMLPQDLCPSFYQLGGWYYSYIHYTLETYILPDDPKDVKLKKKQVFLITKPVTDFQTNLYQEVTTKLKVCCCPMGSNVLKVNFEKDYYQLGEKARIFMKLDNANSKLDNISVIFSLLQVLTFDLAKGDRRWYEIRKVYEWRKGSKPKEGVVERNMEIVFPSMLPSITTFPILDVKKYPLMEELEKFTENNSILAPATKGDVIHSEYFLEVECMMKGVDCCCGRFPVIKQPINILFPESNFPPNPLYTPNDWNPQIMELLNLNLTGDSQQVEQDVPINPGTRMIDGQLVNIGGNKPSQNMEFVGPNQNYQ